MYVKLASYLCVYGPAVVLKTNQDVAEMLTRIVTYTHSMFVWETSYHR